jgi:hypothetical protein
MAISISRKSFFSTINVDGKIDSIEFYPSTGKIIISWAVLIMGLIIIFVYLYALIIILLEKGRGEVLGIIFMLATGSACVIYSLKTYEPSLLIRFFKSDYFLKSGIFGKNIIYGNLSELKDIEIDFELNMGDQGGIWVDYWIPILKWKDGKQFGLGKFSNKHEAEDVTKELCNRLKIGYVDKSQNWENDYWENIGRIWESIGRTIEKIWRKP